MRIWLVQTGEEMPSDPGAPRLLRMALLARELARRGHEVVYWNAAFSHQAKRQRRVGSGPLRQEGAYDAMFLRGPGYRRNVSPARIVSQMANAADFVLRAPREAEPEVVVCGFPTIELAAAVARFAQARAIPYVIDSRDMWPEVIADRLRGSASLVASPLLASWRRARHRAFAGAAALVGISDAFVEWACSVARRERSERDRTFHLAADLTDYPADVMSAARAHWDGVLEPADPRPIVYMAANLSGRVDIMTAVEAGAAADCPVRLVICGKGDLEEPIATLAAKSRSLIYAGWCDGPQLRALAERANAGVLAYSNVPDLLASFPNKVGEYLSLGLPIITCLRGETQRVLDPLEVVIRYDERDPQSALAAFRSALAVDEACRAHARAAFHALFDPRAIYPAYADLIETLGEKPAGSAGTPRAIASAHRWTDGPFSLIGRRPRVAAVARVAFASPSGPGIL